MALSNFFIDPKKDKAERYETKRLLKKKMSVDNLEASEIIRRAASRAGISPSFLGANAMQEGMNLAIADADSGEYIVSDEYPVDGFLYYGLDNFGEAAERLKKKGYLPKDFDFMPTTPTNEKNKTVNSGAFKTHEDALFAKAAFLKDFQDQVKEYSQKKGLKLDDSTTDYLTMSAYNGGMGNARIMIDELATGKYNPKEYVSKGLTSRKGVHKNIEPRLKKMSWIYDDFYNMLNKPTPISAPPTFPSASNLMQSVFGSSYPFRSR